MSKRIDASLGHFVAFFKSAANHDKGMKLLQWTLWMVSAVAASRSSDVDTCNSSPHGLRQEAIRKLCSQISLARCLHRFYGLPEAILAFRTDSWAVSFNNEPRSLNTILRALAKVMAVAMIGYYPMEHLAFLKEVSPRLLDDDWFSSRWAGVCSLYSNRCWGLCLMAELLQSFLSLKTIIQHRRRILHELSSSSSSSSAAMVNKEGCSDEHLDNENMLQMKSSDDLADLNLKMKNELLSFLRSVLFSLPCLKWSFPGAKKQWLSEEACSSLMWFESIVCMCQAIKDYQEPV